MQRIIFAVIVLSSVVHGENKAKAEDIAAAAKRPNVLLILVDDLKPALNCFGDKTAIRPSIDRLASQGMRLEKA